MTRRSRRPGPPAPATKAIVLALLALLPLLTLLALPALAQGTPATPSVPAAVPAAVQANAACDSVECAQPVQPAQPIRGSAAAELYRSVPAAAILLRDEPPQRSAARDWNSNMTPRAQQEDFNCLLSFGVGGTFGGAGSSSAGGYKAVRVGGTTHTISPAKGKETP